MRLSWLVCWRRTVYRRCGWPTPIRRRCGGRCCFGRRSRGSGPGWRTRCMRSCTVTWSRPARPRDLLGIKERLAGLSAAATWERPR